MKLAEIQTPALLLDSNAMNHNLGALAEVFPGSSQRPHVKAHKSTDIARAQMAVGHTGFTCATIREVEVLAEASLGNDLLLANEVVDATRLGRCADSTGARITLAVDSDATVVAAARGGVREVLIDVNIGLPRCGVAVDDAGRLADFARSHGLDVRGVMGYEGHLMMVLDSAEQQRKVDDAFALLTKAHAAVGGDIISGGGTGTFLRHRQLGVLSEVQCGSYALMDSQYAQHGFGFRQAIFIAARIISVDASRRWMVADCGLKALGMDHGNPTVDGADVWFCSDEHITFAPHGDHALARANVGDYVLVTPAHCDPTVAYHEQYWVVERDPSSDQSSNEPAALGDLVVTQRWSVDMRGW